MGGAGVKSFALLFGYNTSSDKSLLKLNLLPIAIQAEYLFGTFKNCEHNLFILEIMFFIFVVRLRSVL